MPIRLTVLTDPSAGPYRRRTAWLAADGDGVPVGSAFLRLSDREEQSRLAEVEITVHPAERRRGTGSLLLEAAAAAARADGREILLAVAEEGDPGEAFLAARGLRRVLVLVEARLPLADTDEAELAARVERPYPGYRLVDWDGAVPDDLLERYLAARPAMDDMPVGATGHAPVRWTAERLRLAAEQVAERGDLLHTVAVLSEEDGAMVAFTELVVPGDGTGDGQHYGTGVLPAHRGRGLTGWMKAASIGNARRRHPALEGLMTDTAEENTPMRRANDAFGYRQTRRLCHYRLDL
ncbi:GNAT family N-acetyltransferase [Kitasatospora sp. DSM 101779]|uniref:GNAT family N-acetyltransferase n=1 Tax=Kitasatospora sp. DSM 101779 TaxID=2853165 RepID=UPI0021D993D9|nr:GNAT family N-acetyltransferase [Kitasatospora sp. DSM 101779]MCU7823826.1 GNAT family N-acetyltransferase [Kitasatospora sp. DSM 101779]